MSYSLESMDDGHIILFTMHQDFDVAVDMPHYLEACYELVENGPDKIVIITDATEMKPSSLDDIIEGANSIRSDEAKRLARHPKVVKSFSIITSKIAQLAVKGLNTATFGFLEVTIFETPEEAINRARQVLYD
jgi:hypothetical protein